MLSLLDQKEQWLDCARGALPGTPSPLEFFALQAALDRLEAEGLDAVRDRHDRAAAATRAGLRAVGARLWVEDREASRLVTVIELPDGIDRQSLLSRPKLAGADLSAAVGPRTERLLRLNHTGQRANREAVHANLTAVVNAVGAQGLDWTLETALSAADTIYRS